MVSASKVNGDCDVELLKGGIQVPLIGFHLTSCNFGTIQDCNVAPENSPPEQDQQSLLNLLLLSQWEDRSWKGSLKYDVTACETKIVDGGKQFIAQLNDKVSSSSIKEFENKFLRPLGCVNSDVMERYLEEVLFCISDRENFGPKLVHSTCLPNDSILVIANVNPVDYGHVFLVPHVIDDLPLFWDKKMLLLITRIASEINNATFYGFFDYDHSTTLDKMYFQASYFANPFPVELSPAVSICSCPHATAISICEVADYPLKSLVFTSRDMSALVDFAAELCSILRYQNSAFSLLVTNGGRNLYLFPQVQTLLTGRHLSAWECGGFFVYRTEFSYDNASEDDISTRLAAASLDDCSFLDLKRLCCSIAAKYPA